MGDEGEFWRDVKAYRREQRDKFGENCMGCIANHPKRNPSILMPGQRCKWCGYADKRKHEGEQI